MSWSARTSATESASCRGAISRLSPVSRYVGREVGESTHHTHEVIDDEAAEWCICVLDDRFAFGPVQL